MKWTIDKSFNWLSQLLSTLRSSFWFQIGKTSYLWEMFDGQDLGLSIGEQCHK